MANNDSQKAHLWVESALGGNPCKPLKKNNGAGSNFFWDEDTIYSYGRHFPIARVIERNGKKAVLFTTRGYSNTTAGHIREVKSALRGRPEPVFNVESPSSVPFGPELRLTFSNRAMNFFSLAKIAVKRGDKYIRAGLAEIEEGNAMAAFFEWEWRLEVPEEVEAIKAESKARLARLEAKAIIKNAPSVDWHKAARALWLQGLPTPERPGDILPDYRLQSLGIDFPTQLRLVDGTVETSRGAEVSLKEALKVWEIVGQVKASGKPFKRNGVSHSVGDFTVESIAINGDMQVGCHFLAYAEMERFINSIQVTA